MASKKKQKYNLGSIIAIPLPDGRFAYAKVFKDDDFGVYPLLSEKIEPLENVIGLDFVFFYSTVDSAILSGDWPVIGEEPFADEDAAWGPPKAGGVLPQFELGMSSPLLSHKGEDKNATIDDLVGLDIAFFSTDPDMFIETLVDRLINDDHAKYVVQP